MPPECSNAHCEPTSSWYGSQFGADISNVRIRCWSKLSTLAVHAIGAGWLLLLSWSGCSSTWPKTNFWKPAYVLISWLALSRRTTPRHDAHGHASVHTQSWAAPV